MILRWGQVFGDFLPKHDYKWLMSVLQIYLKITIILLSDTIPNGADCLDGEKGNFLKAFSCSWIFFYSGINTPKLNNPVKRKGTILIIKKDQIQKEREIK